MLQRSGYWRLRCRRCPHGKSNAAAALAKTARKLGIANQRLDAWLEKRQQGTAGASSALMLNPDQLENRQLKAALALTVMERAILKKATPYFAKLAL